MAGNYKVPSVTVAVAFIIFASSHFMKTCFDNGNKEFGCEKCNCSKGPAVTREGDMMVVSHTKPEDAKYEELEKIKEEYYKEYNSKYRQAGRVVSMVADFITILTAMLIYSAVSDNGAQNTRRRHLLLPFIVWHIFCVFLLIVACLMTAIYYRTYIRYLAMPLMMTACLILIIVLCITMVHKYYRSLAVASQFTYAQMEDVQEVKKPLA